MAGLAVLAAALVVGLWLSRTKPAGTLTEPQPVASNLPPGATAGAMPTTEPGFQKLIGRWVRPDGGYILEIRSVGSSGKMAAAYLNPRPIHVARAEASQDGTATKVFIELRDVNYPGSTYTLSYEPTSDQLAGIYFQATLQQQFEVAFERLK